MKRLYLMSFDPFKTNHAGLYGFLDASTHVLNWRSSGFAGAVIILSSLDIRQISHLLRGHMGDLHFIVSETNAASIDGMAPQEIWRFVDEMPEAPPLPAPRQTGLGLLSKASLADALLGPKKD